MTGLTGELRPGLEPVDARRHDLDALRAFAMLLGIALHAALSFTDFPWVVQDRSRESAFGLLVLAIHGFRMPLFFLLSGFFTAMLWRRRGMGSLLRHRAKRIALPLVLACVTVVPATWVVMGWAESSHASSGTMHADSGADIWTAAAYGNLDALRGHVEGGAPLDGVEPRYGHSPLGWAVLGGQDAAIDYLLEAGADPNARYRDQNAALHTAAFFGRAEAADRLLEAGADVDARNVHGETPLDSLRHDRGTTEYIAGLLQIPVDFATVAAGRERIREWLVSRGATSARAGLQADSDAGGPAQESAAGSPERLSETVSTLMRVPFFQHLWFLWFLCWLVAGFALAVVASRPFPRIQVPSILIATPLCLLWLVPLTLLTQSLMHGGGSLPGFGADDSAGLVPMPHVLAHYAIFFGFGALMYGRPGAAERLGRGWWLQLSLALLLVPFTLALSLHTPEGRELVADEGLRRLLSNLGQVLFAWLMIFGLMGLFGKLLGRERPGVRYVSDSSYWLYLVHLPLIIVGQALLRGLDLPATVKFTFLVAGSTLILLASYQLFVRHTWIGRLLNGPRARRQRHGSSADEAASASC